MRGGKSAALAAAAGLALWAGCRTVEQVGREALRVTPQGRRALAQFDRYAKVAHLLRKYHDSGALDERDVLDVLRSAGVIPGETPLPPPRKPGAKPPPAPAPPKPFPVPDYKDAWRWPLEAGVVSSEYGPRWGRMHHGLDIAADLGVPVYAAAPGEVLYAGNQLTGYGNVVIVRHDQDTTTLYGHNKRLGVKVGDKVAANQEIALLGSTGRSTGPHVHFEIRVKNKTVDPRAKLPKSRF